MLGAAFVLLQDEDEMGKFASLFPPSLQMESPACHQGQNHHHLTILNLGPFLLKSNLHYNELPPSQVAPVPRLGPSDSCWERVPQPTAGPDKMR